MDKRLPSFESRLVEARRSFFFDGKLPEGLIPDTVLRSWERSRGLGLSASDRRVFNPVSRQDRSLIEARSQPLVACALPEMEKLHVSLGYGGWVIACVDLSGVVIKSICGSSRDFRELAAIMEIGRDVSEQAIGTNGPGGVLVDRQPVVIRSSEHFLDEIAPFDCVAVPLFNPKGALIGVLDATRHSCRKPVTILDTLNIAAHAIQNRMLMAAAEHLIVAVHYRLDLLDTPLKGLLSFDEDGYMVGANQAARHLLGLTSDSVTPRFEELFDGSASIFRRAMAEQLTQGKLRTADNIVLEARFMRQGAGGAAQSFGGIDTSAPVVESRKVVVSAKTEQQACVGDANVRKCVETALRAFERDIPILINGETGTGKEVLARMLHKRSSRATEPFVAINCASIPVGLIESEFFGYEDGAYTGGKRGGAPGKFEHAKGGTLFLDEIGDMPLDLQGRLLRVLQERSFCRLGGVQQIPLEARIVAATHRQLKEWVAAGHFREDLYYRINGVRVALPPLRERADMAELIDQILLRECHHGRPPSLSHDARQFLLNYLWPGNIRQLEHALRIALVFCEEGEQLGLQHLPEELLAEVDLPSRVEATLEQVDGQSLRDAELLTVRAAMENCGGNVSAAARRLGVARATLYRKLRQIVGQDFDLRNGESD